MPSDLVRLPALLLIAALLVGGVGCAGARASYSFDTLEFPVSTSGYVYDAQGKSRSFRELQVLGELRYETEISGMFYSAAELADEEEIATEINRQVRALGGEGVVNFTIGARNCDQNYVPLVTIFPFYPGCAEVVVSGLVVKTSPPPPPPPAPPPLPAPERPTPEWPAPGQPPAAPGIDATGGQHAG